MKRETRKNPLFGFLFYPLPKQQNPSTIRFYNGRRVFATNPPAKRH